MISLTSACQCFCITRWPPSDGYRVTLYGNAKSIIMEVIYRKIADIHPLPDNPRTIGPEDLERLKESIRNNPDYLEAHPLVLSDRTGELIVIDGNQRLRACLEMGMEEVPTALLSGLTEEREKEIIIRANVLNGKWDIDKLLAWDGGKLMEWGLEGISFPEINDTPWDIDDNANVLRSPSYEAGAQIKYLHFEGYKIPVTDDELEALKERARQYMDENGVMIGFVTKLLGL